jgi:dethiobiotin synthetase
MKKYFVTGIDTNAGKTVASAILTEALLADYWKPIQAGDLDQADYLTVKQLITNTQSVIHQPAIKLSRPMSPHIAAAKDGINIALTDFTLPATDKPLIVEGAGGVLAPINNQEFVIDLIKALGLEVILVSRHYLGSINHTLLTARALQACNIPVKGIIFNGDEIEGTEEIILRHTGYEVLGHIAEEPIIDKNTVARYAAHFSSVLYDR